MRILLADRDSRVCSALSMLIRSQPGWRVVGSSRDVHTLLARAEGLAPDLIVLDWDLAGKPSARTLEALHRVRSSPKVVVISGRPELETDALQSGADAFVSKIDSPDGLLSILYALQPHMPSYCHVERTDHDS